MRFRLGRGRVGIGKDKNETNEKCKRGKEKGGNQGAGGGAEGTQGFPKILPALQGLWPQRPYMFQKRQRPYPRPKRLLETFQTSHPTHL